MAPHFSSTRYITCFCIPTLCTPENIFPVGKKFYFQLKDCGKGREWEETSARSLNFSSIFRFFDQKCTFSDFYFLIAVMSELLYKEMTVQRDKDQILNGAKIRRN
jgi:hypothetical protein